MSKTMIIIAAGALAAFAGGCYIGRAEFSGEDMRMYPFFGTAASQSLQPAAATCSGGCCSE